VTGDKVAPGVMTARRPPVVGDMDQELSLGPQLATWLKRPVERTVDEALIDQVPLVTHVQ
jgi:hypothetical protein